MIPPTISEEGKKLKRPILPISSSSEDEAKMEQSDVSEQKTKRARVRKTLYLLGKIQKCLQFLHIFLIQSIAFITTVLVIFEPSL